MKVLSIPIPETLPQALKPTFRTSLSHLSHFLCLPGGTVKSPHHQRRLSCLTTPLTAAKS